MYVTVVDGNDRIIGSKHFDKLTNRDIYRVSALWITNSKGQVLLAKRQLGKRNDPGKWGPAVAGTVEDGESYERNMIKEAQEEIGLSGTTFSMGPRVRNHSGPHQFFVQWFTCSVDWPIEKFKVQESEVKKIEWVSKNYLAKDLQKNPDRYVSSAQRIWNDLLS